jgi:hypothetical protein
MTATAYWSFHTSITEVARVESLRLWSKQPRKCRILIPSAAIKKQAAEASA